MGTVSILSVAVALIITSVRKKSGTKDLDLDDTSEKIKFDHLPGGNQ